MKEFIIEKKSCGKIIKGDEIIYYCYDCAIEENV